MEPGARGNAVPGGACPGGVQQLAAQTKPLQSPAVEPVQDARHARTLGLHVVPGVEQHRHAAALGGHRCRPGRLAPRLVQRLQAREGRGDLDASLGETPHHAERLLVARQRGSGVAGLPVEVTERQQDSCEVPPQLGKVRALAQETVEEPARLLIAGAALIGVAGQHPRSRPGREGRPEPPAPLGALWGLGVQVPPPLHGRVELPAGLGHAPGLEQQVGQAQADGRDAVRL